MLVYEIIGRPTPWAAPRIFGKVFYSPKHKEKLHAVWQLKAQKTHPPLSCPVWLSATFVVAIPKRASGALRQQMLHGAVMPIGKPDRSNYLKFAEDCLQDAGILSNDSVIVDGPTRKIYGEEPKTILRLQAMTDYRQKLME